MKFPVWEILRVWLVFGGVFLLIILFNLHFRAPKSTVIYIGIIIGTMAVLGSCYRYTEIRDGGEK